MSPSFSRPHLNQNASALTFASMPQSQLTQLKASGFSKDMLEQMLKEDPSLRKLFISKRKMRNSPNGSIQIIDDQQVLYEIQQMTALKSSKRFKSKQTGSVPQEEKWLLNMPSKYSLN